MSGTHSVYIPGTDAYIELSNTYLANYFPLFDTSNFDIKSHWSIEFIFQLKDVTASRELVYASKYVSNATGKWLRIYTNANSNIIGEFCGQSVTGSTISANTPYHFILSFNKNFGGDGGELEVYLNGERAGSYTFNSDINFSSHNRASLL